MKIRTEMTNDSDGMVVGTHELMKSLNKKNVLDVIMREQPVSRTAISQRVQLAMPTVMRIVDEFVSDGLVLEVGKGTSTGGRKPNLLSINDEGRYFLGALISKNTESVVADINGEILAVHKSAVDFSQDEAGIRRQLKENMRRAVQAAALEESDISYAGLGTPGMGFKYMEGISTHVYKHWSKLSDGLYKEEGQFAYPTSIMNVAKLGAFGELKYGVGKKHNNYLYIYADYGVGMGSVRSGVLDMGMHGTAGEFGHTTINRDGPRCYCGNRGCVESYCSTIAMQAEYKRERINLQLPIAKEEYSLEQIQAAAEAGEQAAIQATTRVGGWLGTGIANVINLYDPGVVVVGGELTKVPYCIERAFDSARKKIFRHASQNTRFYISESDHGIMRGAVAHAIESFFVEYCKK